MNKLSGMLSQVMIFILSVALATVDGWGACTSGDYYPRNGSVSVVGCAKPLSSFCSYSPSSTVTDNNYYYANCTAGIIVYCSNTDRVWNCHTNSGSNVRVTQYPIPSGCGGNICGSLPFYAFCTSRCDNSCEADSLKCLQNGGTWTNTGASTCDGKSCKMSNCLQSDTLWLNDSKAACDAIGGENNYAITDIDETCVRSGICCPPDSALVGNTCKWRCDSLYNACTAKNGYLYAGVLQDTTISGADSTFTNKCYYNCSYAYNKDSTTSVTDGNTACSSPSTPIADCTRMPNDFSPVRTTYGDSVYSYDFLTPGSAAYIDSIVLTPCSRFMYRCTVNGKYKYWYSDADIPTGCTNIVKIK